MVAPQPPGNRLLGALALLSGWSLSPPAIVAQGSSRLEAKQALQFSNLELTNSQFISFKKTYCHNEIQVSQMIFLMEQEKKRPILGIRRKQANFGQSPWEPASSARTADQSSRVPSSSLTRTGDCKTKAHYEVIASNQPIKARISTPRSPEAVLTLVWKPLHS